MDYQCILPKKKNQKVTNINKEVNLLPITYQIVYKKNILLYLQTSYLRNKDGTKIFAGQVLVCRRVNVVNETNK